MKHNIGRRTKGIGGKTIKQIKAMPSYKNELGDKCFVDTFRIDHKGIFVEIDGISFDSAEYDSGEEFLQGIVDRVYDCAMGKLN